MEEEEKTYVTSPEVNLAYLLNDVLEDIVYRYLQSVEFEVTLQEEADGPKKKVYLQINHISA